MMTLHKMRSYRHKVYLDILGCATLEESDELIAVHNDWSTLILRTESGLAGDISGWR